jgi:hypothetical protein
MKKRSSELFCYPVYQWPPEPHLLTASGTMTVIEKLGGPPLLSSTSADT